MDPSLWTFPRPGFRIEYNSFERFTDCGGNYSDASGNLYSPNYPNAYPELADCIYLISQPSGTFINITFDTIDIDCQGTTSDFIEMRDGSSKDSQLMGRFCGESSSLVMTTQNHLRVRSVKRKYLELRVSCEANCIHNTI